jgi:phosphoglycolate phosphatase
MENFQTILFDLDGTLTDPQVGITRSVQYALRHMGIHESDRQKLIPFIGPPLIESFREFYGMDEAEARRAVGFYREYFSQTGIFENVVYPGISDLLQSLRQAGKTLAVATSKPTVFSKKILDYFSLAQYFDLVVGSNLDGTMVEKADVVANVLAKLPKALKNSTVMIGDRKHDVIGAQRNGIASIAVGYGYGTRAELEAAAPTQQVGTIEELAACLLGL